MIIVGGSVVRRFKADTLYGIRVLEMEECFSDSLTGMWEMASQTTTGAKKPMYRSANTQQDRECRTLPGMIMRPVIRPTTYARDRYSEMRSRCPFLDILVYECVLWYLLNKNKKSRAVFILSFICMQIYFERYRNITTRNENDATMMITITAVY